MVAAVRSKHAVDTAVLSGGVFQNHLLLNDLHARCAGLRLWTNHVVPPNDGGISLGQAALAALGPARGELTCTSFQSRCRSSRWPAKRPKRGGARVSRRMSSSGVLSGVVKEALMSAYEMASEGTALEGTALIIDEIPAVDPLRACASRIGRTRLHEWFSCEVCGTPATDIVRGRELELAALELE